MGYMRISLKSPTALSFRYTTIFKFEKKVCVCGCLCVGGWGGGGEMSYKSKEFFSWEKNRYHEVSLTNQKSMMLVHVFYCIQAFQEGWCIIIIDEPLFCMGTYRRRFRRSFSTKTSVFSTKLLHHNNFLRGNATRGLEQPRRRRRKHQENKNQSNRRNISKTKSLNVQHRLLN